MLGREDYVPPVGFASEPIAERRRWIGRFFLLLVIVGLGYIVVNRVINPQDDVQQRPPTTATRLPGPV
ncbi:MAG TPA: hypothetical protein VM600_04260 [Actinomycetota bacterium]|nr:hypothetical protein [Actinomycetota bacterium]